MGIDWKKKIKDIPTLSGVYIFKDDKLEPIYVGKAISLKNRLRSYFTDPQNQLPKTRLMVENARDLEYIATNTELEALILESNLIKRYRPKYNVRIKDDKRYPWLKFTYGDDFPRLFIVRFPRKDKHRYFGPFPNSFGLKKVLKLIHTIFRIRTCKLDIIDGQKIIQRPCLEYDLKRCDAPCVCWINKENYRKICNQVCLFLEGRMEDVVKELEGKMAQASENMKYEEAGVIRDQINAIHGVQERQNVYTADMAERDILGAKWYGDTAIVVKFLVRGGKLMGKEKFRLDGVEDTSYEELIGNFILQHYFQSSLIPKEIFLPIHPEDEANLSELLTNLKGNKVSIVVPQIGEKRRLIEMAEQNAELHLQEELIKKNPLLGKMPTGLLELQQVLKLDHLPLRIEAYDISHIGGTDTVGSMVVLKNGVPYKAGYRRFKIKTVEGIDDFASMKEVIHRRMKYLFPDSKLADEEMTAKGMEDKPDLILIDGGVGQLNAAGEAIREIIKKKTIPYPILGLAKKLEEIFLPGSKEPILLPYESKALQLLQQIRDEAHRFAVTYHRSLRGKKLTLSVLDEIPGIGNQRKKNLMKRFGSIENLQKASFEEIKKTSGMNKKSAQMVYQYFKKSIVVS